MNDVLKTINLSAFLKTYLPEMSAYRLKSGKYTEAERQLILRAIDKLRDDLIKMAGSSSVAEPSKVMPGLPLFEAAPVVAEQQKKGDDITPPIATIPNLEPYKYAEPKPKKAGIIRHSVMSW